MRETALSRQYAELDNQVYPDGAQIELSTGYHQVSLQNFLGLARTAILNRIALPADYYQKLRRMFEYNLWVQMPDGRTPALNDGALYPVRESLQTAAELYHDPLFAWAASGRTKARRLPRQATCSLMPARWSCAPAGTPRPATCSWTPGRSASDTSTKTS